MPILATITNFESYSRMGDVSVIGICIIIFVLLSTSYVKRTKAFRIFSAIVGLLFLAAIISVGYHELIDNNVQNVRGLLYSLRLIYQILLFQVFFLFTLYTAVISNLEHKKSRIAALVSSTIFSLFVIMDIVFTLTGIGFSINKETNVITQGVDVFVIGSLVFVLYIGALLLGVRKLVYKRVMYGFYAIVIVCFATRIAQYFLKEASLTTLTFVLPVIGMMYIMHANPINVTLGTLDAHSLEDLVATYYRSRKEFIIMSLMLPDYMGEGKSLPEAVRQQTRRFSKELFRNGILFQVANGQLMMIAKKSSNPDYVEWIKVILKAFKEQYDKYKMPYKIVYGESIDEISETNEYISLIEQIHANIPDNTMHLIDRDDIERFKKREFIVAELEDIYKKHDLDDPRVLAYCQPVFNINTGRFDTAEALMRLNLNGTIIYPDQFIQIAEARGFIHVLTLIIMNKTCQAINRFVNCGYRFKRISVNVSVLELKDDKFCDDINAILERNNVDGSKLAIEITESHSEADFYFMKEKIQELHGQGIVFYLDDFGTGYSNMERILELPFDIIKFDRSMVIASGSNARSEKIVENLAKMFKDMEYSVLYEGVEDVADENRCISMAASYLQGFKYSKPIPIDQLRDFLARAD